MKKLLYIFILSLTAVSLTRCTDTFDSPIMNSDASFELTTSDTEVILSEDFPDEVAFTLTWSEPDYEFDNPTPDFEIKINGITFTSVKGFSVSPTAQAVNLALIENELVTPDVPTELQVDVVSVLGQTAITESVNMTFTAYAATIDQRTQWGVVGSATPNSWDGPDVPFFITQEENVLETIITLTDGEIKIRKNNDWPENYGDNEGPDDVDGNLVGVLDFNSGTNIPVLAGTYRIEWNTESLEYKIEPFTSGIDYTNINEWGLVGSATPNSWDGPDIPFFKTDVKNELISYITLIDGEIKIRKNNAWTDNYGDNEGPADVDGVLTGILEFNSGTNIPVTSGTYEIKWDTETLDYSIKPFN